MGRALADRRIGELVSAGDQAVVIMRPLAVPEEEPPELTANLTTFRDGRAVEMVHYASVDHALAVLSRSE